MPEVGQYVRLHSSNSQINEIWQMLRSNRVNALVIFVPLGLAAGYMNLGAKVIFSLNFLAIIPLAAILSDTTDTIAESVGPTVGGLLNASFGNVVELIVALVALYRGEIRIVQTSMLGSILSNLLLVLGISFIAGGYNRLQQQFNQTAAQTMSSLMALSCLSLVLPTAFIFTIPRSEEFLVLTFSRTIALVLLAVYMLYLVFQLKSHRQFFEASIDVEHSESGFDIGRKECITILAVVTLIIAACADFLVGSIDELVQQTGISKTFVGLILLPIVGNAAEHATAVIMAMRNKIDLCMNVALGSSMQISLFMIPFLVLWGWVIDVPMTLYFHMFETTVLLISVYVANLLIQDGESNWFEGVLLVGTYLIVSIAFFFYPES